MYLRGVALTAGHTPEQIETMPLRDLELMAVTALSQRPFAGAGGDRS